MKTKLLFLLVSLFILTMHIPSLGATLSQVRDVYKKLEFKVENMAELINGEYKGINGESKGMLLDKRYFYIKYSLDWKIPLWVAYHISTDKLKGKVRRTNDYSPDLELPKESATKLSDYEKSGYAKGHHVTPEAFKSDKKAMSMTFLLSTISPQNYYLNRNLWPALDKEIIYKAADMGDAWVLSGNLWLGSNDKPIDPKDYIGTNGDIAVPTHFFKVILFQNKKSRFPKSRFYMEAYLIPNQRKISMKPIDHLITVDELEVITGYNFFPGLDEDIQNRLESNKRYKKIGIKKRY